MTSWTAREREYLARNYGLKTPQEIADALGRSRGSVIGRANRQGLTGTRYANRRTLRQQDDLRKEAKRQSRLIRIEALSKMLQYEWDGSKNTRDLIIWWAYDSLRMTLADIGLCTDLSRQRILQIIQKHRKTQTNGKSDP